MPSRTFDLVLVAYRLEDMLASIRFCEAAFASLLKGRRPVLVLNDERLRAQLPATGLSWEVIAGSNRLAEFSGWQEGLDRLQMRPDGLGHSVVFVNDTVVTHRSFRWPRLFALRRSLHRVRGPAMVGFGDRVGGHFAIGDLDFDEWVSTYCFGLTSEALERLGFRICDLDRVQACVPGGTNESLFFAGISASLDHRLRGWLFGGGWYKSQPLATANRQAMELKAKCIIAEKLLSATCFRLAIAQVDPFLQHRNLHRCETLMERLQERYAKKRPGHHQRA